MTIFHQFWLFLQLDMNMKKPTFSSWRQNGSWYYFSWYITSKIGPHVDDSTIL